ncbi:probable 6-phosphogluconolactonase 2 [Triticum aestivum]|uniref:probable 6-phosphogluconolactonase 2 n=1 Tax=Triticum aestivum TaxID=4565 RepID=UPI001D0171A4|nr:probable 6-phosphogluconolactonase 2 [Triticum aestivum]
MRPSFHGSASWTSSPQWLVLAGDSPRPPPERIAFALHVINSASNIAILATGVDKAKAVHLAVSDSSDGPDAPASLPAKMVQPTHGKPVWFLDKAAASSPEALPDDAYEQQHREY